MTPGCVMSPSLSHVRTPTPPRPASPPPYSPPSPIYHPDPTPSPARTNTLSYQTASPVPSENTPSGSENVNTGRKTPETAVFKRHTVLIPSKTSKICLEMAKFRQQIEKDLPKVLLKFCHEIMENIMTYD